MRRPITDLGAAVSREDELRGQIQRRGFRGLSAFARSIGVARTTLYRAITDGDEPIELRTAKAIAEGLGISVVELIELGCNVRVPTYVQPLGRREHAE